MSEAVKASVKDEIIRMIQRLPNDCTLEDIQYHLFVRARIEQALKDLEDGDTMTQEEFEKEAQTWLKPARPAEHGAS